MQQQPTPQFMQQQQQPMQQQPMQQAMPMLQPAMEAPVVQIDFPEAIKKQIADNGVPTEAYAWTDEKVSEYIRTESARRCAPVIRACPRGAKKCKCRSGVAAGPFLATVTQMREYAERIAAQTSYQQEQQVSGQLQIAQSQEQQLQNKVVEEQKSMEGYQLLSAALAVCLVISVGFNYMSVKGTAVVGGRDANMRSEVKAAIASMTRA